LETRHLHWKILCDIEYTLPWFHLYLIEEILVIHRGFTGILDGFDMHGVIGDCGRLGRVQDSGNHYLLHFLHRRHAPKIHR
jgi:hypothetical protein